MFEILPNTLTFVKVVKILPKWWNFAKSCNTGWWRQKIVGKFNFPSGSGPLARSVAPILYGHFETIFVCHFDFYWLQNIFFFSSYFIPQKHGFIRQRGIFTKWYVQSLLISYLGYEEVYHFLKIILFSVFIIFNTLS